MIHKKKAFGTTPAPRLNYALGGGHEHKVEQLQFISGTMFSEPVPLGPDDPLPEEMQTLDDIGRIVEERTAKRGNSNAIGGNSTATDGETDANGSQDPEQEPKKNKALAYDWTDLNDEFEAAASFHNGKGEKLFGHYIISLAPGETLTPEQWQDVITEYMDALGYDEFTKFCGFVHNETQNQHCHILTCRVKMEKGGPLVDDSNDYEKGMACMRRLEKKYGLQIVANPEQGWGKEIKKEEFKYLGGDRETALKAQLEGPKKDWAAVIRARVKATWNDAKPRDMAELVHNLKARGVDIKIRTNKQGEPEGISYKAHGSDVWISGSKVMPKRLTWQNLIKREGIKYSPVKHNAALGLPEPADKGYVRADAYQPLNKIQVYAIKKTKLRVRLYHRNGVHYAGFGFDQVFTTGKERYEKMMNDIWIKLVREIMACLFNIGKVSYGEPIITHDGERPKGMEEVRDEVGNACYDVNQPEGDEYDWQELEALKNSISETILKEHREWIRPTIERGGKTLDNDMQLEF